MLVYGISADFQGFLTSHELTAKFGQGKLKDSYGYHYCRYLSWGVNQKNILGSLSFSFGGGLRELYANFQEESGPQFIKSSVFSLQLSLFQRLENIRLYWLEASLPLSSFYKKTIKRGEDEKMLSKKEKSYSLDMSFTLLRANIYL